LYAIQTGLLDPALARQSEFIRTINRLSKSPGAARFGMTFAEGTLEKIVRGLS
jgi:hypothetical protein